jgi:hypothetical protein
LATIQLALVDGAGKHICEGKTFIRSNEGAPRWFKAKQNGFHLPVLNRGARRTSQELDLHVLFLTAESHSVVLVGCRLCHFAIAAAPAWTTEPELFYGLPCPSNTPGHLPRLVTTCITIYVVIVLASHERSLVAARSHSEPAGQIAAREIEIVRIKRALQRADELSDDVAAAIEPAL